MHFDGAGVPELAERLRRDLDDAGLRRVDAIEEANGTTVFNAVAAIAAGEGMELWLSASEQQGVGCKVEFRLFHALEDSAEADEYLSRFRERVIG